MHVVFSQRSSLSSLWYDGWVKATTYVESCSSSWRSFLAKKLIEICNEALEDNPLSRDVARVVAVKFFVRCMNCSSCFCSLLLENNSGLALSFFCIITQMFKLSSNLFTLTNFHLWFLFRSWNNCTVISGAQVKLRVRRSHVLIAVSLIAVLRQE